jgi:hypothetical protein
MRGLTLIGEQSVQRCLIQAASDSLLSDSIAESLKLGYIQATQTLEFMSRDQYSYIAVVATDRNRLPLGGVQQRSQPLLGVGSRDVLHQAPIKRQ